MLSTTVIEELWPFLLNAYRLFLWEPGFLIVLMGRNGTEYTWGAINATPQENNLMFSDE